MKLLALQHGAPPLMARRLALRSPRNPTSPAVQAATRASPPPQQQRRQRRAAATHARPRRGGREQHDYNLDNFVSFDSEDEFEPQGTRVTPSAKPFVAQAFSAVAVVVDRLTDVAYTFVPQDTPVKVVRTAVGGGLLLLILSFAKSVLGFLLTLGSLVLGAYIAVRILGLDLSGVGEGEPEVFKEAAKRKGRPVGGRRDGRGRQSEFKGLLGSADEDEDGLLDVWFERNKDKYRRPR